MEWFDDDRAGMIEQHVVGANGVGDLVKGAFDLIGLRHIGLEKMRFAASFVDHLDRFQTGLLLDVDDANSCALAGESQ